MELRVGTRQATETDNEPDALVEESDCFRVYRATSLCETQDTCGVSCTHVAFFESDLLSCIDVDVEFAGINKEMAAVWSRCHESVDFQSDLKRKGAEFRARRDDIHGAGLVEPKRLNSCAR